MSGKIDIRWLGQAGFIIKNQAGTSVAIDPYLGDSCEKLVGYHRMMPAPMAIKDFCADHLFISHEHPDHLDIDIAREIAGKTEINFYGNSACREVMAAAGLAPERMRLIGRGDVLDIDGFKVEVVASDHGKDCPNALGFILDFGFVRVYFAGDTAYTPELLSRAREVKPEIALLPINGAYGNLNNEGAARLAADIGCQAVIPCHFWMFIEHGSNPGGFREELKARAPGAKAIFLAPGEHFTFEEAHGQ